MSIHWNKLNRTIHYWGSAICALPVIIIIVTGMLLIYKKDVHWIQPLSKRGVSKELSISFDGILEHAKAVDEVGIKSWKDIDRLDVRPKKGLIKIRAKNRWEIQMDSSNYEILQVAYRRSDLIESIHDGSFFHDGVKYWVFFPASILLLVLWITGLYLFLVTHFAKRKKKLKQKKSS